ncbi:Y4yA family PLP-dependent enzyme [Rhodohalobacter sp. SW132]|uniref:Y4yA family PLP-dependent enzyme n=1 Tax=Rhodohalobacter sp. SW132 TaxID=2293433 RepID=UPI0018F5877A|nr:Y4yA family PLP-dependent enzyme [Rhodohalobacter sp. SW132]
MYPPLTPITDSWMKNVFSNLPFLEDLFKEYGSPINILHTGPFQKNYEQFSQVFEKHKLSHTIFFARKANRCKVFVKEANRLGFGVDTASYLELKQCLEMGVEKLVLTAAVKDEKLVHLALQHDVLIILDNEDECRLVNRIAGELGKTAKIGIRISGFRYNGEKLYSRFGFDIDYASEFIKYHLGEGNVHENLRFDGFHFHLDGYSTEQRSEALLQTIHLADRLLDHEIETSFIDMGGGILINYLSSESEWETFWSELKKAVRGDRSPVTFGNNGLGYELINGELRGEPDVYPYYNENSKVNFLDDILSYRNKTGETPADLLRERGIEIRIEPGRSLLDQTGFTMAKVIHRKKDSRGNWLIGLEMNRSQLSSSSADFLLDPVFIQANNDDREKKATPVYFTGGYCLEQDIILKRKIVLPCLPEPGDIVCFPNTAGYLMHFYETRSHLYDFTTNVVIDEISEVPEVHHEKF